ncbi:phage head-binding domain-containing protein [Escherichia coli]
MTDITANVVVSMPSQLFTMARSFKAVANGKIYIGKIDTDPVNPENQIQVYVENEDGSHVPVSQPIIINVAGYPVYNGQIAKFVTVQGHSMAVYDAYGARQFYFPNVLKYDPDQFRQVIEGPDGAYDVGYTTAFNNNEITVGDALDNKIPNIIGNVDVPPTGFIFHPFTRYSGDHDLRYINGGNPKSIKRLKKTGNATVTLNPITTESSSPSKLTVDTVGYVNPANADPDGTTFPTGIKIDGVTFEGDDAGGQSGLTILQGHNFQIKECGFSKTKIAIWLRDVWMSSVRDCSLFGQYLQEGGTSMTIENCYATVHDSTVTPGAFRISNLQYSSMSSCASDGTVNTAYYFNGNNGLKVTSCGSEVPTALDKNYGTAAHFEESNEMILDNFYTLPASGSNILFSIKNNNDLVFNNTMVYGDPAKWSRDFWLLGSGNKVVVNGGTFGNTGRIPLVATNAAGNTFIYNSTDGNSYIAKTTGAAITVTLEPKFLSKTLDLTSDVVFANSGPVTGGTKDIKFTKSGNIATVEFNITIPDISGKVGQLLINGLPYAAAQSGSGSVSIALGLATGVGNITCVILRDDNQIMFYKSTTTSGVSSVLGPSDLINGSSLRGSITYSCVSDWD